MTATEYVILVDENDHEVGKAEKRLAHEQNLLHRAFSVFIFREHNGTLETLLQQRALHKYHSAGLWTNTCCSHPRIGEAIQAAALRRLQEEMGIAMQTLQPAGVFHYNAHFENGLAENEIDHVLVGLIPSDTPIAPHPDEVLHFRWQALPALHQELAAHPTRFTPWFERALILAEAGVLPKSPIDGK